MAQLFGSLARVAVVSWRIGLVALLCVALPNFAGAQVAPAERSFDEFIAAQGTYCLLPYQATECLLLNPPLANTLAWTDGERNLCAFVDYAGVASRFISEQSDGAIQIGTTLRGRVTETVQSDGYAEMTVSLFAENALIWVVQADPDDPTSTNPCSLAYNPVVFGNTVTRVLEGATPTLGSATLRARVELGNMYIPRYPGEPLPDLFQILAAPPAPQGFLDITFVASANSEEGHFSVMHKSVWGGDASYRGPIKAEMVFVK